MSLQNLQNSRTTLSYVFNCRMALEPAALEQLCQVARIRRFRVARMVVEVTLPRNLQVSERG
jgi:acetolactate synthase II small subunit